MKIKNSAFLTDCTDYHIKAVQSKVEIKANLEKVIKNLGEDKAKAFLVTANRMLEDSVNNLRLGIEKNDANLCAEYAHKLKGSSNLYASKALVELLAQATNDSILFLSSSDKCRTLSCEFELVMRLIRSPELLFNVKKQ